MAKAIHYALTGRDALTLALRDGRVRKDNNATERSMRPLTLGRKNGCFADRIPTGNALRRSSASDRTGTLFARGEMIGFTAQRLMALEVRSLTGAEPSARTADRLN